MRGHMSIYVPAFVGSIIVLAVWLQAARALGRRGASRWRAVPLFLPLVLMAAGYGLYWWAFFSSPAAAVQAHAIRLTIAHAAGAILPWIGAAWLAIAVALLRPLWRRPV
jgi:hypothetical protein